VTLIELLTVTVTMAGALSGAIHGSERAGWPGALAGAPLGIVIAWAVLAFFFACLFGPLIYMERRARRKELRPHFGTFWKRSEAAAWRQASASLVPGTLVRGSVVVSGFGEVTIDLGCGFPAVLGQWNLVPPEDCAIEGSAILPDVGENVEARILLVRPRQREIVLTQKPTSWLVFASEPIGVVTRNGPAGDDAPCDYRAIAGANARLVKRLARSGPIACEVTDGLRVTPALVRKARRGFFEVAVRTSGPRP
jgi:hypothetical protein